MQGKTFCEICDYEAKSQQNLVHHNLTKSHLKKVGGEPVFLFSCDKCAYFTNDKRSYDGHLGSNKHNLSDEDKKTVSKEKEKQRYKKRYEDHKEEFAAKKKIYYENHKDELYEKKKQKMTVKIDCECGGFYSQGRKMDHTRTKLHQSFIEQQ